MSASPEMVALVYDYGSMAARAPGVPGIAAKVRAIEKADDARASLLAAIAKLEAARDEATRRLAAVEETVRAARDLLNSDADGGWAAKVARAVVVLNNALEKQP